MKKYWIGPNPNPGMLSSVSEQQLCVLSWPIVSGANARVEPLAVVVKVSHTLVTQPAMFAVLCAAEEKKQQRVTNLLSTSNQGETNILYCIIGIMQLGTRALTSIHTCILCYCHLTTLAQFETVGIYSTVELLEPGLHVRMCTCTSWTFVC